MILTLWQVVQLGGAAPDSILTEYAGFTSWIANFKVIAEPWGKNIPGLQLKDSPFVVTK
jgi:hypothetical protein